MTTELLEMWMEMQLMEWERNWNKKSFQHTFVLDWGSRCCSLVLCNLYYCTGRRTVRRMSCRSLRLRYHQCNQLHHRRSNN